MPHFPEVDELSQLAEEAMHFAKKMGADQSEFSASINDGFSVNVRMGSVETVEHHREKDFVITVYRGKKTGSVSASDTSKEGLFQAVEKAYQLAKYTEDDPYSGLPDKSLLAKNIPDLNLYHPWKISVQEAMDLSLECESFARHLDSRITNSEGVSLSAQKGFYLMANSEDFCGVTAATRHSISCCLVAEKNGSMERDYSCSVSRDADDLISIQELGREAVDRCVSRLGSQRLTTRSAPVIFINRISRSIISCFIQAISGGNLYRRASFLLDHLGKPIFPKEISIFERPFLLKALGSASFDRDGVETKNQSFVEEGVLTQYVLSDYSAKRLGLTTTGNAGGLHNGFISHGDLDLNGLLKKMDTGLLVTELIGHGVNIITGDYSCGAVGFWVERGEIQYPVSEITISGNLKEMFMGILAVGKDIDRNGSFKMGSLLIDRMMIAGD